jgi:hypothetical protein
MSLTVDQHNERGPYILAPKGYFPAKCTGVKYLGEFETEWNGIKKIQKKILMSWVLEGVAQESGEPYLIAQRYTLADGDEAKLRNHVTSWKNPKMTQAEFAAFDLESLVGQRCQIFIEHKIAKDGKTFANVVSIGEAPQVNFQSLSKKLEACWTHAGIDVIKGEAVSARQQQIITSVELNQLAAMSKARRTEIDNPAPTEDIPQF